MPAGEVFQGDAAPVVITPPLHERAEDAEGVFDALRSEVADGQVFGVVVEHGRGWLWMPQAGSLRHCG